ncbi:MAG: autotransporter-associated beta strand repeat-containing protein [Verrucomicrobiota bacterium]
MESRSGGVNFAAYSESVTGGDITWNNSTTKSTAPGTTAALGSRFCPSTGTTGTPAFTVQPTLVSGTTYLVEVTHTASSASTTIIAAITQTDCTGLPATTDGFQGGRGNGVAWYGIGYITTTTTTPTIKFAYSSGTLSRFYADAVRFTPVASPTTVVWSVNTAWVTPGNWVGGFVPSAANVAQPTATLPTASAGWSINIADTTQTPAGLKQTGPIEFPSTRTANMTFGNSSTTVSGTLQIWGATVNSVPNTVLRNASASAVVMTIQNVAQSGGSQTMALSFQTAGTASAVIDATKDIVISSVISTANNGITKIGAGTLTLTGNNTYTGRITVSAGTLKIGANGQGTAPGTFTANYYDLSGGATLNWTDLSTTTLNTFRGATITGSASIAVNDSAAILIHQAGIAGSGTLTAAGPGEYRLYQSGSGNDNTGFTGNINVTGGRFTVGTDLQLGAIPASAGGQTITLNGGTFSVNAGVISHANRSWVMGASGGTYNPTSDLEIAGPISGSGAMTKAGAAKLTLSGVNSSYGGAVVFTGGTLALGSDTALGTGSVNLNIAGGIIQSSSSSPRTLANAITLSANTVFGSSSSTTGDLIFNGTVTSGGLAKTLTISNSVTTLNGVITGTPSPASNANTKDGPGTLVIGNAANTTTKPTIVNAGTLRVSGNLSTSPSVTVNGGIVSGSGTLPTVVINNTGTISPGSSPGTLTTGAETWNGGGTYLWEVNNAGSDLISASALNIAATSGSKFTINVTALEALTGWDNTKATNWTLVASGSPITGFSEDKFTIVDNFSAFNSLGASGKFSVTTIGNNLVLAFSPINGVADAITRPNGAGTQVAITTLLGNDTINSGSKSISAVSPTSAAGGQIELDSTTVYYNPPASSNPSSDTFTYTLSDGNGNTATVTVTVTINGATQARELGISGTGVLSFNGLPNTAYQVQYTDNLDPGFTWTAFTPNVTTDSSGKGTFTDTTDPRPSTRYYRIVVP